MFAVYKRFKALENFFESLFFVCYEKLNSYHSEVFDN